MKMENKKHELIQRKAHSEIKMRELEADLSNYNLRIEGQQKRLNLSERMASLIRERDDLSDLLDSKKKLYADRLNTLDIMKSEKEREFKNLINADKNNELLTSAETFMSILKHQQEQTESVKSASYICTKLGLTLEQTNIIFLENAIIQENVKLKNRTEENIQDNDLLQKKKGMIDAHNAELKELRKNIKHLNNEMTQLKVITKELDYEGLKSERRKLREIITFKRYSEEGIYKKILTNSKDEHKCEICNGEFDDNLFKLKLTELQNKLEKQQHVKLEEENRLHQVEESLLKLKPYKIYKRDLENIELRVMKLEQSLLKSEDELRQLYNRYQISESDIKMLKQKIDKLKEAQQLLILSEAHLKEISLLKNTECTYLKEMTEKEAVNIVSKGPTKTELCKIRIQELELLIEKYTAESQQLTNDMEYIGQNRDAKDVEIQTFSKIVGGEVADLTELKKEKEMTEEHIRKINSEAVRIEVALLSLKQTRCSKNEKTKRAIQDVQYLVNKINEHLVYFNNINQDDLNLYEKLANELQHISREVIATESMLSDYESEFEKLHHELKRTMDKLELANVEISISNLNKEISALGESLKSLPDNYLNAERSLEDLQRNIHGLSCTDSTLRRQASSIFDDLKKHSSAEIAYYNSLATQESLKLTVEDLDLYISSLQKSIKIYHQQKISQINQILSCLWQKIYRGLDIDNVQIKLDSNLNNKKKEYYYRVIYLSKDKEVTMRGNSSAGQRGLASIVIRMALAECFSSNCPILALDEPTTNLDKEHVESLAHYLAESISNNQEMQIIIITHDKEFISMLREHSERIIEVTKDENGGSIVNIKDFVS